MKKVLFFMLFLPVALQAQDQNQPFVRFDQGSILFYVPSQGDGLRLLPAYKPGFVHTLQTPGNMILSPKELSDHLVSGIKSLISKSMTPAQKNEFLKQYACLILLIYTRATELDSLFYKTAVSLKEEDDPGIATNAALVVKMYDMYK